MKSQTGVALAVAGLFLLSSVGPAAAAVSGGAPDVGDEFEAPAFVVALEGDGSATVVVTFAFDLSDESRRDAFEDVRDNATAREEFRSRFEDRIQRVASAAGNETRREMSVSNATLEFRSDGTTGVVETSVTWNGLAAVDGDQLRVTEPFASGFSTERSVHVLVPDGYGVDSVTPPADSTAEGTVTYGSGTDLTGFELVASPDATATATATDADGGTDGSDGEADGSDAAPGADGPGFTAAAALLSLVAAALLAWRRH